MPRPGGGHLRYNPHKLARLPAALVTATSLDQAVAPPDVRAISTLDRQHPDRGHRPGDIYGLVCESGRYVWEMLLAALRLSKATVVDFAAVTAPVLMMGAECDRIVPSGVVRQTAARYRHGTSVEIPRSDHMVFSGAALPVTMGHIDYWIARNHVLAIA